METKRKSVKQMINAIEEKINPKQNEDDEDTTTNESETTEEDKKEELYKCVIVKSNNTNKYYADVIKTNQPENYIYHNYINRYKLYINGKIKKYSPLYKLISYNDIYIVILENDKTMDECMNTKNKYIEENEGVCNNDDIEEVEHVKVKRFKHLKTGDKKLYSKQYYKDKKDICPCYSKEKSRNYYLQHKEERLQYSKNYYRGLKEEILKLQNNNV